MNLLRNILIILFIFICIKSYATEITIQGSIVDANKSGIANADIRIATMGKLVKSQTDGSFSITVESNNEITIDITAQDYAPQNLVLQLQNKNITGLVIKMEKNLNLNEVEVTGNNSIETVTKVLLFPTALEKKHSPSGYDLLKIMNIPDINSDKRNQTVTNANGQQVHLCINGVDADPMQVATLASRDIIRVEYQRVPTGKHVGKPALINFITKQWTYGGNVFLNADETIGYQQGNYLAYADIAHQSTTYSVTANARWISNGKGTNRTEIFDYNNLKFTRQTSTIDGNTKENNQFLQFRTITNKKNHNLTATLRLIRKATPENYSLDSCWYSGSYNMKTLQEQNVDQSTYSPYLSLDYTLNFKNDQSLNLYVSGSYSKNKYNSSYAETNQQSIFNNVNENAYEISGYAYYTKSLPRNISLSGYIMHSNNFYNDKYTGSNTSEQNLTVGLTSATIQFQQTIKNKFFYYLYGGVMSKYTNLNTKIDNYLSPTAYYGGSYTINSKNSLSLNGFYTSTNFDPSLKNDMALQSSFFEITKGNPNLAPIQCFQNTLTYNTTIKNLKISAIYDFLAYLDNAISIYSFDSNYLIKTLSNDGNFYGNKFILSLSYPLLNNNLRLKGTFTYEHCKLIGSQCNATTNGYKGNLSVTYLHKDWSFSAFYTSPRRAIYTSIPRIGDSLELYGVEISWSHKEWSANLGAINFLKEQREMHQWYNFGIYNIDSLDYSNARGRNIYMNLTYSFSFGRKTQRGDTKVNSDTNNAIMGSPAK